MGYLVWSGNANMAYEVIKLAVYGGGGWASLWESERANRAT
jgi:hypothetical protein